MPESNQRPSLLDRFRGFAFGSQTPSIGQRLAFGLNPVGYLGTRLAQQAGTGIANWLRGMGSDPMSEFGPMQGGYQFPGGGAPMPAFDESYGGWANEGPEFSWDQTAAPLPYGNGQGMMRGGVSGPSRSTGSLGQHAGVIEGDAAVAAAQGLAGQGLSAQGGATDYLNSFARRMAK